jgi:hypothetical protein
MYVKISWRPEVDVCQAILETGSGRKLSHNGCTAGNFDLPDHDKYVRRGLCLIYLSIFYFWSPRLPEKCEKPMCVITRNIRHCPSIPL